MTDHRVRYWIGALAWLVLTACSGDVASGQGAILPPVKAQPAGADAAGCNLVALHAQFEAKVPQPALQSEFVLSPDGSRLAVPAAGGARIFDLRDGSQQLIEQARPVEWSADSRKLYVLTAAMAFASIEGGRVAPEPWLDSMLDPVRRLGHGPADPDLLAAGSQLLAVTQSPRRVSVTDLARRSSFSIDVGARWKSVRSLNSVMIGWDVARSEPAVFITHQWFNERADPASIEIHNRVEVHDRRGALRFAAETRGTEVGFLPWLVNGRVLMLARRPEFRCIRALAEDGSDVPWGECSADLENALVDRNGNVVALKYFLSTRARLAEPLAGAAAGLDDVRLLGIGDRATVLLGSRKGMAIALRLDASKGVAPAETPLGPARCATPMVPAMVFAPPRGRAIEAKGSDGELVHGFLFEPAQPAVGLVVSLHGGPRGVATEQLSGTLGNAMLEKRFAVLSVNYRGGTGYGRKYLEAPYGRELEPMLADAEALAARAAESSGLAPTAPRILHGVSFGGYIALKAALSDRAIGRRVILEASLCDLTSSPDYVAYGAGRDSSLKHVSDPDLALHALRLATRRDGSQGAVDLCRARLPSGVQAAVLHSKDDPIAPFARMQQFMNNQPKSQVFPGICDRCGHAPFGLFAADDRARADATGKILEFLGVPGTTQPVSHRNE